MTNPIRIVIHHEGGSQGFKIVNEYHKQKWNFKSSLGFYLGYHYYIDKTGKIWQGREDTEEGAHAKGYNQDSLGICLEGDFSKTKPPVIQWESLKNLVNQKMKQWTITPENIMGHRKLAQTSCPGDLIIEKELKNLFQPDLNWIQKMIWKIQELLIILSQKIAKLGELDKDMPNCIDLDNRG